MPLLVLSPGGSRCQDLAGRGELFRSRQANPEFQFLDTRAQLNGILILDCAPGAITFRRQDIGVFVARAGVGEDPNERRTVPGAVQPGQPGEPSIDSIATTPTSGSIGPAGLIMSGLPGGGFI